MSDVNTHKEDDDESQTVDIELMEITSAAEIEITENSEVIVRQESEDQHLINEEIKEEELEDANLSQDIKSQGKRLLLKDWLIKKLDNKEMPDILSWVNKPEGLFRIKWLHKATDSWQMTADGILFKEWCTYTGKYDPKNENPRKWKANFRCALNSLPDVIIVPNMCIRKGKDAYRVFKILPEKIPEKVREKQESSRKRRREKRESLLRANNAKLQVGALREIAPAAVAAAATEKGTAKKSMQKKLKVSASLSPDKVPSVTVATSAGSSTTTTTTSTGKATVLNGMDALCTAAAMMADKPNGEQEAQATVTLTTGSVPIVTPVSAPLAGDIVTYYRPIGPIQLVTKDGSPTVLTNSIYKGLASPTNSVASSAVSGLSVYRHINPVQNVITSPTAPSSPGNLLLNVRLAPPTMSAGIAVNATKVQGVIPQISGIPHGICLKPVSQTSTRTSTPTYLIPKTLLQRQIGSGTGNQPARVLTVKADSISSPNEDPPSSPKILPKITKSSSLPSACQPNEVKIQSDMVEYYNLKANVAVVDYANLKFQSCKHTQYITFIRLYDSEKPNVEISVSIYPNCTFNIVVHNKNLPASHEIIRGFGKTIKSVAQITLLLQRLNEYVTCIGNPEEMPHQQYSDYSSFCSAFQEPDFGAKNKLLRYYSTIRSSGCQLLIKSPTDLSSLSDEEAKDRYRCDECTKIRTQVLSMRGLFCLVDGTKISDTENARKKRLQLLKEFTTKEVLANRISILESQIRQLRQYLPTDLHSLPDVTATESEFPESIADAAHFNDVGDMTVVQVTSPETKAMVSCASDAAQDNTVYSNHSDIMLVTDVQGAASLLDSI